ncbi:MAG: YoaK family protein [Polyangiaceae bacterium]
MLEDTSGPLYRIGVFSHEGPSRSATNNGILAGYLALVAGFVNSSGFVLLGTFTSHVTGSVGRLANDLATSQWAAASLAAIFVVGFFAGAFFASILIQAQRSRVSRAYGLALLLESVVLAAFVIVALTMRKDHPRILDAEAAMLCFAMGMQNSLVTNLSGAVIRTTHLTGVVTDLGIESARWHYWLFTRSEGTREPRPSPVKAVLLLTILIAFTAGALSGALFSANRGPSAMLVPSAALLLAAWYALLGRGRGRGAAKAAAVQLPAAIEEQEAREQR